MIPKILVITPTIHIDGVNDILESFANRRHIFNLGHGIVPQTPPEHVTELLALVRS